jgi:DNA-binding helix-hairpin-helix protein with protein kinase domain
MNHLRPGQSLRGLSSTLTVRVEQLLGEGGQGGVYLVEFDGQHYALKWYHDMVLRVDRGLLARLQVAIDRGAPAGNFLWPFELVTLPDGSGLGYLMRLRGDRYEKVANLLHGQVEAPFRVLSTMCCQLTDALFALHSKGLAYQDLNAGNVFFDPQNGDIEICDNDNVDIDGAPSVMGGVWEFQAPEVVLRQAGPSRATDLHSLAVMLFRILHMGHPLVGARELAYLNLSDEAAMRKLYGTEARFVFDPADDSNRPLPDRHGPVIGHWAIYPQFLRDLFTRAFTEGLYDPSHGRVQETEWRRALAQLRDAVHTCPQCGAGNFYDMKRVAARQPTFPCWNCATPLPTAPLRLGLGRAGGRPGEAPAHVIVLEPGARVYGHQVGSSSEFATAVGEVRSEVGGKARVDPAEEKSSHSLVLHNLSRSPWTAKTEGSSQTVASGASIALCAGLHLDFGRISGVVKA